MLEPPLPRPLLLLLLLAAAAIGATALAATDDRPERRLNVLAGGHMRIVSPSDADHADLDDAELLTASASGAKDKKRKQQRTDDEQRKTLAQQVADGRYGLIQKELFGAATHKKPGLLSYDANAEVPADTADTLGGLHKNEIWLAENHLLVVRGGAYPQHDDREGGGLEPWPAIDDYRAPKRPVKLPAHPKVPPPFPVRLSDDGPLQILGTNHSRTLNGSLEQAGYPVPPPQGYVPGTGPFFPPLRPYPPDAAAGPAALPGAALPALPPGERRPGAPFPPPTQLNGTFLPPYFASLPPGAVVLPPPPPPSPNGQIDEDDPSIYYPPPYSFYYPTTSDNATGVRPGPLVPGIILPPPPDFFAPLEEETTTVPPTAKRPTHKYKLKTTTKPLKQIRPTTTPVPSTSVLDDKPTRRPTAKVQTPAEINNELKPVAVTTLRPVQQQVTTLRPVTVQKIVTVVPVKQVTKARPRPTTTTYRQRKPQQPGVTILKQIVTKPTVKPPVTLKLTSRPVNIDGTPQPEIYIFNNEVTGKPFAVYGPPPKTKPTTTTTQLPIKVYYTTSNEIETNSVTELPIRFDSQDAITINKVINPQPNYYYYDGKQQPNRVTTPQTIQELQDALYQLPRDFYVPGKRVVPSRQKPRYQYNNQRPYTQKPRIEFLQQTSSRPDSFKLHISRLQKQLQYYTTQKPSYGPVYSPKPVYQYSFEAANYHPQQNQRPVYNYQQQSQNQYYQQRPQFQPPRDYRNPQPLVDNSGDKFRPMPHYSVQIQAAVDLTPTERPQETVYNVPPQQNYYQSNSEKPAPTRYYNNRKPEYDYEEFPQPYKQQIKQAPTTPRPVNQGGYTVTPNPIYQGFYTKPDEGYFDDQTKTYFTIFGKKIPNATTPIPPVEYSTPASLQVRPQRPQQPISLAGDTLVNYLQPRPEVNPDAEFVQVNQNREKQPNYPRVVKFSANRPQNRPKAQQQYVQSTAQNQQPNNQYSSPGNNNNNNPEIIKAIPIRVPESDSDSGSFISYELPGDDGAHFYFLTPQLAQRREQGARYFYSQPDENTNRVRYERQASATVVRSNVQSVRR